MTLMPAPGRAALHLHPGRGLLPLPAHRHGLLPRHRLAQGQRGGEAEHHYIITSSPVDTSLHLTASPGRLLEPDVRAAGRRHPHDP